MRVRIDSQRLNPRKLAPAIEELQRGSVVIYPTDTGYAFGCALSSNKGISTLRRLKGLDEKHKKPLTMMVPELSAFGRYGVMSNVAFRFIRRILPGPYTIVLRASSDVPRSMKNRDHEVGMRLPDDATCMALMEGIGEPLLTGSLTPGEETPELEEPELYLDRYSRDVQVVIDTGPLWPEPSTVLRFSEEGDIEVLREGQGELLE